VTVTGIITALLFGAIIGGLARLVLPGRQNIPVWLTIAVGVIGALIGTFLARTFGVRTSGFSMLELILQIVVAALVVTVVARAYRRRSYR
jgi:uncharacterized membrane protein YeaQ/YmgE (transglycosylase-associated protein family)